MIKTFPRVHPTQHQPRGDVYKNSGSHVEMFTKQIAATCQHDVIFVDGMTRPQPISKLLQAAQVRIGK